MGIETKIMNKIWGEPNVAHSQATNQAAKALADAEEKLKQINAQLTTVDPKKKQALEMEKTEIVNTMKKLNGAVDELHKIHSELQQEESHTHSNKPKIRELKLNLHAQRATCDKQTSLLNITVNGFHPHFHSLQTHFESHIKQLETLKAATESALERVVQLKNTKVLDSQNVQALDKLEKNLEDQLRNCKKNLNDANTYRRPSLGRNINDEGV